MLLFTLCASTAAHADSVAGNSFTYQYLLGSDTSATLGSPNTFTADGTTYTSNDGPFTYAINNDSQLVITFTNNATWANYTVNGPEFIDNSGLIGSVLFDAAASTAAYSSASILYPATNAFAINWEGLPITAGQVAVFDISSTAATPEPSSLWLLGSGMVAGAGALRRRMLA